MHEVGVLFSGGLDSTYLIWKNLEDGNIVYPIYCELLNNEHKTKVEKKVIENLLSLFQKEYDDQIKNINYISEILIKSHHINLIFKQLPIWMINILYSNLDIYDEIQIGYVMNDDIIPYIGEVKNIYDAFKPFMEYHPKLTFPLIKNKKEIIIPYLPDRYKEQIFSCENPQMLYESNNVDFDYKPCCECEACNKILYTNNFGFGLSEKYEEELTKIQIKELERKGYELKY